MAERKAALAPLLDFVVSEVRMAASAQVGVAAAFQSRAALHSYVASGADATEVALELAAAAFAAGGSGVTAHPTQSQSQSAAAASQSQSAVWASQGSAPIGGLSVDDVACSVCGASFGYDSPPTTHKQACAFAVGAARPDGAPDVLFARRSRRRTTRPPPTAPSTRPGPPPPPPPPPQEAAIDEAAGLGGDVRACILF